MMLAVAGWYHLMYFAKQHDTDFFLMISPFAAVLSNIIPTDASWYNFGLLCQSAWYWLLFNDLSVDQAAQQESTCRCLTISRREKAPNELILTAACCTQPSQIHYGFKLLATPKEFKSRHLFYFLHFLTRETSTTSESTLSLQAFHLEWQTWIHSPFEIAIFRSLLFLSRFPVRSLFPPFMWAGNISHILLNAGILCLKATCWYLKIWTRLSWTIASVLSCTCK